MLQFPCIAFFIVFTFHLSITVLSQLDWTHHDKLDKAGKFKVYWAVDKKSIFFRVEVATSGWFGFGAIGEEGTIYTVVGWVKANIPSLHSYQDEKGKSSTRNEDRSWKLLSGYENKTHTVLTFSLRLTNCKTGDRIITRGTQEIIYTYHPEDPEEVRSWDFKKRPWMKGFLHFLKPRMLNVKMPESIRYWDLRVHNLSVPNDETTFFACQVFRSPPLRKKHHIIKASPIILHKKVIHEIAILKCIFQDREEAEMFVRRGSVNCMNTTVLSSCPMYSIMLNPDMKNLVYPLQTGVPIGINHLEYFALLLHYQNPFHLKGIVDNSGMRLYYTPQVRAFDAAMFAIETATYLPPIAVIPPGQKKFILHAHAHPQCLSQGMLKDGIKIFALWLHAHHLGRRIQLRHFRDGKELQPIGSEMNYNSNYQDIQYLSTVATVLSGDQLTVECTYDSSGENITTFTSLNYGDEFCDVVFYYYPPLDVVIAESSPLLELMAGLTGIDLTSGDYRSMPVLGSPNPNYRNYLMNYNWDDDRKCTIQDAMRFSPQRSTCISIQGQLTELPTLTYPQPLEEYDNPKPCSNRWISVSRMHRKCNNL